MLVLSRKPGETIKIGDAELTVIRVTGNRVTLGIDAPKRIPIVRGELCQPEAASPPVSQTADQLAPLPQNSQPE